MKVKFTLIFLLLNVTICSQNEIESKEVTIETFGPIIASEYQVKTILHNLDRIIITLQQKISENSQFLPLIFENKKPYEQWQQAKQAIAQLHSLIIQMVHSYESIALLQRNKELFNALKKLNQNASKNAQMSKKDKEYIRKLAIVFRSSLFEGRILDAIKEMENKKVEIIKEQERVPEKSKDEYTTDYLDDVYDTEDYYDNSYFY